MIHLPILLVTSKTSQVAKSVVPPPVSQTVQGKIALESRFPFAPTRPKCNSILHLFGAWLFDAALAGVKLHPSHAAPGIGKNNIIILTVTARLPDYRI